MLRPEADAVTRDRVVVLCLANRCRSPMAGALFAREVEVLDLPVDVATAGFSEPGLPATSATIDAASTLDLDLRDHRSVTIEPELLADADLVLGMERAHVREAVVLEPSIWPRTFTLREAVRRAEAVGPREAGGGVRARVGPRRRGGGRPRALGG